MVASAVDSSTVILLAVFYYFIKYGEANFYFWGLHTLAVLLVIIKIPETPKYLYSKKKWVELHACFDKIAEFNKAQKIVVKFDTEDHDETEEKIDHSLNALF